MDIQNFKLNGIFDKNAKEYHVRPVKAMKYRPGIENGWMVYFESNTPSKKSKHFGVRFFPAKDEAQSFIDACEEQYAMVNGVPVAMEINCDASEPVLYMEKPDPENKKGVQYLFGDKAFISDESEKYEFYILDCSWCKSDTWIIQDMDGNIRVWDRTMEEWFFGKDTECAYERNDKGEYIQVAL